MSQKAAVCLGAAMIVTPGLILGFIGGAFLQSWLVAILTCGLVPLGAIALLMVHQLTGGEWGHTSRPILRALGATLPLFLLGMLPLAINLDALFSWLAPLETLPEVVHRKTLYLNEPFLLARWLLYAVLWLVMAWGAGVWRTRSVRGREWPPAIGLILWLLSLTFFGFDWFMSLEPRFYSDVYGLMLCMLALGAAFSLVFLLEPAWQGKPLSAGGRRDLANLLLSVQLGWGLMAFSQFIIIWSGNLPHEIEWYLHRREMPWHIVSMVSFGLLFVIPVLTLMSGAAKGHTGWPRAAAASAVVGYLLQMIWLVAPAFGTDGPVLWLTPVLIIVMGIIWGYVVMASRQDGHNAANLSDLEGRHGHV